MKNGHFNFNYDTFFKNKTQINNKDENLKSID